MPRRLTREDIERTIASLNKALKKGFDLVGADVELIVLQGYLDNRPHDEIVDELCTLTYTTGVFAPPPFDGYLSGSLDYLNSLLYEEFLTIEDVKKIESKATIVIQTLEDVDKKSEDLEKLAKRFWEKRR